MKSLVFSRRLTVFRLLIFFGFIQSASLSAQQAWPVEGTYDGTIGSDRIILLADSADASFMRGTYVLSRGKAVEDAHAFLINNSGANPVFQSDLYLGKFKNAKSDSSSFDATLVLLNRKHRFLFWRPKTNIHLQRRPELKLSPTNRYKDEIFPVIETASNVLYGKARGYWTNSPYTDEPYITVLGKGLVKAFKDPQLLDLNLDIYYPKGDFFKSRPLVMLIHGGAFYIGSKESVTEKTLATALAKRGYVVASIDYRLGFKMLASDIELSAYRAVQDARAALRFLSHNAKGLGIDPTQIYVGGTSAGGVASLNVAYLNEDNLPPRVKGAISDGTITKLDASGNKYTEGFEIKAVANMWGAVSDLNIMNGGKKIPVLSIHGTADDIVPFGYDYPFQNSMLFNRLVMDKMYGSKPICDQLKILGIRNRLVALAGLGHEPELASATTLNSYMDTITTEVSKFFYEETAPRINLPESQLKVSEEAPLKPLFYEVENGVPVQVKVRGGMKANADTHDATVIWFRNSAEHELIIQAKNKFEAWNSQSFRFNLAK
jgi:acetyl esterase/lipase